MANDYPFQIINFGADLLGSYYTAKQSTNSLLTLPPVYSNVSLNSRNSAAETPWDQDNLVAAERLQDDSSARNLYKLLTKDYNAIAGLDEFINKRDTLVRASKLDDDSKNLFVLYNALKDLKTIADYAGDPRTSERKLEDLETQFKLGLEQVKGFISDEQFDELTLLFGEKKNNVTSLAGLGRKEFDYIGPVIHSGEKDDPISTLNGGETFTITLTRKETNNEVTTETVENINITVSAIEDERTLDTLRAQINEQIKQTKITNNDGDEVPLFNTRFFIEEVDDNKFAFRIKTDFNETMTFSAPDVEPAIYITGRAEQIEVGTKIVEDDKPLTSYIAKLTDLDSTDATKEFHQALFSNESEALLEPAKTATVEADDPLARAAETNANAIATDSKGNLYVVGDTDGRFANHLNTSESGDAFLNKYDATGKLLWSRLVGSQGEGASYAITIDASDNIIVAGQADKLTKGVSNDPLATSDNVFQGQDSFVIKYNNVGTQQWMYLNDEYGTDGATSITTDANGDVYVTGKQNTLELSSLVFTGDYDAYVMKLDGQNGSQTDYIEIGATTQEYGQGVAVASDGNLIVATHENGKFILQKLDKDNLSSSLWSYDFGATGSNDGIKNVVVDGSRIYVSGSSENSLTGGGTEIDAPKGGLDNFILALDDLGGSATADWTKFIGSDQTDSNGGITVAAGKIYLSGTTNGSVEGSTARGTTDSFAMKIDGTTGVIDWTKNLGYATENRTATGVAFATEGTSVLTKLGLPIGTFADDEKRVVETQTTARAGDYFYIKVNNHITKKIEIKAGDTYRTLANRINRASFQYIKASVTFSSGTSKSKDSDEEVEFDAKAVIAEKLKQILNERNGVTEAESFKRADRDVYGSSLRIKSNDGGRIEIIAGRGEKDALRKLGLEPTLILSSEELFDLNKDEEEESIRDSIGGVFAFKLDDRFSVFDRRDARYVSKELDYAIRVIQSAYRSLTYDPLAAKIKRDALKQANGPVPPHLQKQIANYSDGLRRISAIVPQGGGFIV